MSKTPKQIWIKFVTDAEDQVTETLVYLQKPLVSFDYHCIEATPASLVAPEMLKALEKFRSEYIENLSRSEWLENHLDIDALINRARGEV